MLPNASTNTTVGHLAPISLPMSVSHRIRRSAVACLWPVCSVPLGMQKKVAVASRRDSIACSAGRDRRVKLPKSLFREWRRISRREPDRHHSATPARRVRCAPVRTPPARVTARRSYRAPCRLQGNVACQPRPRYRRRTLPGGASREAFARAASATAPTVVVLVLLQRWNRLWGLQLAAQIPVRHHSSRWSRAHSMTIASARRGSLPRTTRNSRMSMTASCSPYIA